MLITPRTALRFISTAGTRMGLHTTAMGHALLADLSTRPRRPSG